MTAPLFTLVKHYRRGAALGNGDLEIVGQWFLCSLNCEYILAQPMTKTAVGQNTRYCPGEEHILISDAVCFGRRRANFSKCPGCQFNDDEKAAGRKERVIAHGLIVQERSTPMLDKVFKAYDVRGVYPDPLNEELAWRIGFAAGTFLKSSLRGIDRSDAEMNRIVVGRDMRKSSPAMASGLIEGARAGGVGVIDIGMVDTPQLYFAVNHFKSCGGVQTTASHNPAQYTGFKICGLGGKPIGTDTGLNDIRAIAQNTAPHDTHQQGELQQVDLTDAYRSFVLNFLDKPKKMKIVVDASNGMAGRCVPMIFGNLSELEIEALNFEHDGEFAHDPNPLVPANLQQTRDRLGEISADLGVCFDGDADRCMLVDEKGEIISCDLITALLAEYFLKKKPGSTIVYDLRSSRVVSEVISRAGGTAHRSRVGHAFMKKVLAESKAVFGGELSGHFYFQDNWYCDSGMLAFVHTLNVLSRSNQPVSELIAPYRKYYSSGELNFVNEDKDGTIRRLCEIYADSKVDYLDGVTVQYPEWWFNVRKSNTEPLLRLNLEANTPELLERKLAEVYRHLGEAVDH